MRFRKKVWGLKIIFLLFPPYNSPLQRNPFGFFDFLNFLKFQPTLMVNVCVMMGGVGLNAQKKINY